MRTLSPELTAAVLAEESDRVLVCLVVIHGDGGALRFTDNPEGFSSNGEDYIGYPFQFLLPQEQGEESTPAKLVISNVDARIMAELRTILGPLDVDMSLVRVEEPDVIEAGPYEFLLKTAKGNRLTIEGELAIEDIVNEAHPGYSFTPDTHPAAF